MPFDGETYDRPRDRQRLTRQLEMVRAVMQDGHWRTLAELQESIWLRYTRKAAEAAVSARLRDLRKPKFGSHQVERRRRAGGLWEYRVVPVDREGQGVLL